jgi:putative hemolysin
MFQINIEEIIRSRYTGFWDSKSLFVKKIIILFLNKILHTQRINKFVQQNSGLTNIRFIDELFESINFSYSLLEKDRLKIPSEGRLIIVANHPIGSLDSLALIKTIYDIRKDVKIVANEILYRIENIRTLLLPYNLESRSAQKNNILAIRESLENENAVIIFPAAEVSRIHFFKIKDARWNKGAVYFAKKLNAPILPVYIHARNSNLFYLISLIHKEFSKLLLVHELFNKQNRSITINIGHPIPAKAFANSFIDDSVQTKLLKKHVYLLPKNRQGIYSTERNIIHPVDRRLLRRELMDAQLLGSTKNDLKLILTNLNDSPNSLTEIARLREVTFRKVGEGTGNRYDLDSFDKTYKHLIVWDEKELEIVGSYRLGVGKDIYGASGKDGFYTSTLFTYSESFAQKYLGNSVELGRSFIQKKYWNTNALDYLWQGIGAYLSQNEYVKYLFGGVSISNSYPPQAKQMIIYFFAKWFGDSYGLAESKSRFVFSITDREDMNQLFSGSTMKEDYKILKRLLKPYGFTIPVLYKHYSDLCYEGGVKFLDFGIDPGFENCVDGLILVDVDLIKEEKKNRYLRSNNILEKAV